MSRPWWLLLLCAGLLPAQSAAERKPAFTVADDLQYAEGIAAEARRNRLDLYLPADQGGKKVPLAMFVHGGAWMGGSKDMYQWIGAAFASNGIACAVINYRLSPRDQHPAHVEDCARAFTFLDSKAAEHGCDAERMFLIGHSAGAHLISLLALDPTWLRAAGAADGAVKGCIPLSGPMDVRETGIRDPYFGGMPVYEGIFGRDAAVRAKASPIVLVRKEQAAKQPPLLLFWAEHDFAGIDISNRLMLARLREVDAPAEGKELLGENHVGYLFRIGRQRDVILPDVLAFMRKRCAELDAAAAKKTSAERER